MTFKSTKNLLLATVFTLTTLTAQETQTKTAIKSNGQLVYSTDRKNVESFSDMFGEGEYYGRIRSNTFYNTYKNEDASHSDHIISGLGGSLVLKSATLNDFDFTAGLYFSQAFFDIDNDNVGNLKKGKDAISRFDYVNDDNSYMAVVGQAYLRYSGIDKTELILGRQLVETFYTKSNDTKMIPNSFDGLVVNTNAVSKTKIKLAYLHEQKLRDHTSSHSVLMYGDSASDPSAKDYTPGKNSAGWSENDDSAMHKGLTYTELKRHNKPTDSPLIVGDFKNNSIKNLKLDTSFYVVPELLSQIMLEANYKIDFDGFSITPAMRYIKQFDNGAGAVGGASYSKGLSATGYKDIDSLEAQMIAARVVTKIQNYKINLGYTNVLNEADLITPWRGFPTAGYTRSMARYNWKANTQSYRLELVRNANKTGIYKDVFIQTSILYTNADEDKGNKDELYYYIGFIQNIPTLANLQWRLRLGYVDYVDDNTFNDLDARLEFNYLF
ncbi:MAG: OprD family outer membrane porin [Campylobacterota bacterium]|nr:OprD family outer membrane porin [Campylobacterota bacterium]